jgi:hypothetical protein
MKCFTLIARWSSWTPRRWLPGILVSLALCSTPVGAVYAFGPAAMNLPGRITLQDGKLTARIVETPLWQVMAEVSRLSGVQVQWMDSAVRQQEVSVEFTALSLSEAVRRILRAHNFLLVYPSSGEEMPLTQIWIACRGEHSGQPVLNQPSVPQVPVPHVQTAPVAEAPAEDSEQSLDALMETAMGEADLAARLSAIGELGSHASDDARVRELLADLADHDPHPQVRDAASMLLDGGR